MTRIIKIARKCEYRHCIRDLLICLNDEIGSDLLYLTER